MLNWLGKLVLMLAVVLTFNGKLKLPGKLEFKLPLPLPLPLLLVTNGRRLEVPLPLLLFWAEKGRLVLWIRPVKLLVLSRGAKAPVKLLALSRGIEFVADP